MRTAPHLHCYATRKETRDGKPSLTSSVYLRVSRFQTSVQSWPNFAETSQECSNTLCMGSNTHIKHRDMPLIWSQQEIIPARGRWGTWAWQGSLMRISKREVGVVPDVCFTKPAQHTSTSEHHRLAPDLCPLTPAWQKQCGDCQTHQYRPPRFPQKGLSRCRGHLSACSLFC